jgi:hypothetical protein
MLILHLVKIDLQLITDKHDHPIAKLVLGSVMTVQINNVISISAA